MKNDLTDKHSFCGSPLHDSSRCAYRRPVWIRVLLLVQELCKLSQEFGVVGHVRGQDEIYDGFSHRSHGRVAESIKKVQRRVLLESPDNEREVKRVTVGLVCSAYAYEKMKLQW